MSAKKTSRRIDAKTGRPDAAYEFIVVAGDSIDYVRRFTKMLGLKPARTRFGKKVRKV